MTFVPPPGLPPEMPDPRPSFDALLARGRELQSKAADLARTLTRRGPGDPGLPADAVVAETDERGLLTGFRFAEGWREGRLPAELVSAFDLALLEVSPKLPPLPRVDPALLGSLDFSGGPVTATDLSGAFSAVAAYGAVMYFRIDPEMLAVTTDSVLGELVADVGRRAALESDRLGRYALPQEKG